MLPHTMMRRAGRLGHNEIAGGAKYIIYAKVMRKKKPRKTIWIITHTYQSCSLGFQEYGIQVLFK